MGEQTPRMALPMLVTGQGQKDVTHNEALIALDCLVHSVVKGRADSSPPLTLEAGECWIVGVGATGAWEGHDGHLACWTAAGWRFQAMPAGARVHVLEEGKDIRRSETAWVPVPASGPTLDAVVPPSGGNMVDGEARSAIIQLISRLSAAGLISA